MTNIFKSILPRSLIGLSLFLLISQVYAFPIGELIFVHPARSQEIWIADTIGINARPLFKHSFESIDKIEVQEDGNYVLAVASIVINEEKIGVIRIVNTRSGVFLLDMRYPNRKGKDLAINRFRLLFDADISSKGDLAIATSTGLLLIENEQLNKPNPEEKQLLPHDELRFSLGFSRIQWSPDGKKIAYTTRQGLFLYDIESNDLFHIVFNVQGGTFAFSPDGSKIAFSRAVLSERKRWGTGILVVPVEPNADVEIIHFDEDFDYTVQDWSPDGKYIAYASHTDPNNITNIEQFRLIRNHIIPETGGESEEILITMKKTVESLGWVHQTYPVEPGDSLVTTWGKVKRR